MLIGKYEKATCCLEDGWRVLFTPHREAMYGVCDVLLQEEEGTYVHTFTPSSLEILKVSFMK